MRKSTGIRGFTLIEVVISIGILVFMLSIGYGALHHIINSKLVLDDGRDSRAVADAVLLRMVRELQLTYDRDPALISDCNNPNAAPNPPGDAFAGEPGNADTGKPRSDSVTFFALEGGQYLPDGGRHSGVVQLRYYLAPTPPTDPAGSGPYTLFREEIPYIKPPAKACQQSMVFPITNQITSLQFSYYDPDSSLWSDSWVYPDHKNVPKLVKFTIGLVSPQGKNTTYTTSVSLHHD